MKKYINSYLDIIYDKAIIDLFKQIDIDCAYAISHGFLHISNVIENGKKIAKTLNYNANDEKLLLIACSLHDIGRINNGKNHEINGAKLAKKYLKNKLPKFQIFKVCHAIKHHSSSSNSIYKNSVYWGLKLADKLDIVKTRILLEYDFDTNKHTIYRNINNIELNVENNALTFNFCGTDKLKSILDNDKQFFNMKNNLLKNFAKHFKIYNVIIKVNNEQI